jgi:uncharacterized protein (TIGR02246 family)
MSSLNDQIESMYDRLDTAWKSNDGAAVARFFTDDGSLVNPFGERADGRGAIAAMYTDYFRGMLRGTSTTVRLAKVRAVGDTHAFADAEQTITGADGKVVLVVHLAALLRRDSDGWRIVDGRPYAYAPRA